MTDQFPDATKMVLSPAAQAVRRDLAQIMAELHQRCRISTSRTDVLPITLETNDAALQAGVNSLCAAALRAAADQVVPDEPDYMRAAFPSTDWWDKHDQVRSELLSIATELDPAP